MLGKDGLPQPDLYVSDQLHMKRRGTPFGRKWSGLTSASTEKCLPAG